jgi:pimeloyl-ACP methyl ester carboxylesterase
VEESLKRVATRVEGHVLAECGHFVPEERPDQLVRLMRNFFDRNRG